MYFMMSTFSMLLCHISVWTLHVWTSVISMCDQINPIITVNGGGLVIILFFVFADLRPPQEGERESL